MDTHPSPDAAAAADREVFVGGVNQVIRVSDKVLRPSGPWTPAVHALLNHLAASGFTNAPKAYGVTSEGREVLDFIPGEVPGSEFVCTDAALSIVGAMLREMHDATIGFTPPDSPATPAHWYFPPREPAEVICHGDIAPYNTVFRDGHPVAFIDFDTAHPAPRIWDVAYAAFRFVPLADPAEPDCPLSTARQAARLRILADAYGLAPRSRDDLPSAACARLRSMVDHIRSQAAAGNAAFAAHQAAGHDAYYLSTAAYIRSRSSFFRAALQSTGE